MTQPVDRAALDRWAARVTCPACQHEGLRIEWRLRAKPIGSFSLAGNSMKIVAEEWPWLICPGCGVEGEASP